MCFFFFGNLAKRGLVGTFHPDSMHKEQAATETTNRMIKDPVHGLSMANRPETQVGFK